MFLFINYCSDMFRSQFLVIFREIVVFSMRTAFASMFLTSSIKMSDVRGRNMSEQWLINKNIAPQVDTSYHKYGSFCCHYGERNMITFLGCSSYCHLVESSMECEIFLYYICSFRTFDTSRCTTTAKEIIIQYVVNNSDVYYAKDI